MIREVSLSADQVKALMDNAPMAVCVSSADTYKILYANRLAREIFMPWDGVGQRCCYQVAGFDEPCRFCREDRMNRETLLTREYCHPVN
ncbi:hypothetical protein NSB04_16235, partial [Blautia pseudococcoides]|nr:hypothetical protein [Blautia pseudococcoides]